MKKEELLSLGLTEEQADKVIVMNGLSIESPGGTGEGPR